MLEFRIQVMAMVSMFMLPMLVLLQRQGCILHRVYSSGLNNAFLDPFLFSMLWDLKVESRIVLCLLAARASSRK